MIDKVLVLTIPESENRRWLWHGASQMRKIPEEHIYFIKGHAGKDFENMEAVAKAAAADGFNFIEEYAIGTVSEFAQQTPASVSQVWNFARIFRHITEMDETCLVIVDDKMLTVDYHVLSLIVDELHAIENQQFHILQLKQRGDLNEIEYTEKDRFEQDEYTNKVFNAIFHRQIESYVDFFLQPGIKGYEETFIISPPGAAFILETLETAGDFFIFFDHFIHKALSARAKQAPPEKGIYTPAESGYEFVRLIAPMGTTTHWAPRGTHHFKDSITQTEFKWLEIQ